MYVQFTRPLSALILAFCLLVLLAAGGQANAEPFLISETITLPVQADTHINNQQKTSNFGSEHYLELWFEDGGDELTGSYILLRFELQEALGPEVIIDSAVLELYQIEAGGAESVSVTLHPILESWDEGSVHWNNQPEVYIGPWLLYTNLDSEEGWKQIDLTQFADDWYAGDNFGIELRGPTEAFQRIFESKEHNEREPRLVVQYHLPEPPPEDNPDLPDLIVTEMWAEEESICLQLMNTGRAPNEMGVPVSLYRNGEPWSSMAGPEGLLPGERWHGCFPRSYSCQPLVDTLLAVIDEEGTVPEENDENNWREEQWPCDQEPPQFLDGPRVEDLGSNTAVISWTTHEPAEGVVQFGYNSGVFGRSLADPALVTTHQLSLMDLAPAKTYQARVMATDESGNQATSHTIFFTTLPLADGQRPTVALLDPGPGREHVTIQAQASDNRFVERVEFTLNGQLLFIDYSPPYAFDLNTWDFNNGPHQLEARAFDKQDNNSVDTRQFNVDNLYDQTKPQVTISQPNPNETVNGLVTVKAKLKDDTGLERTVFYVDGVNIDAQTLNGEKEKEVSFSWDTRTAKNGRRRIGILANDIDAKEGIAALDVTVNNVPPPRPLFAISSHTATRSANRLLVLLVVENVGTATAKELDISDWMTGFIPQSSSGGNATYDTYYRVPGFSMEIAAAGTIAPGAKRYFAYSVVPALDYPNPPKVVLGEPLTFDYKDAAGTKYNQKFNAPIHKTSDGKSVSQSRALALKAADYLIISNPQRLVQNFWFKSFDVLDTMGRLAEARNGVVGLVQSNQAYVIDALISPYGSAPNYQKWVNDNWATRLHPNFSKPLGGYVLLVGETEIVPSWNSGKFGNGATVAESDYPYGDTGGDGRPDLIVGRAIGDKPQTIMAPLEAAIGIVEGTAGYAFEFDSALMVSGPPAGSFVSDVNEAAKIMTPKLSTVQKLHADDFAQADSFMPRNNGGNVVPHLSNNGLAAGNVLGGSWDEIILANGTSKVAHIYNRENNTHTQFAMPQFNGTDQDLLAVGDVRGDAKAEIIIGDLASDKVYVYSGTGTAVNSPFTFNQYAALAVGNVSGDAKEEILIGDSKQNRIWVGAGDPPIYSTIVRTFEKDDRLLAADIMGSSYDEIIHLDWSANTLYILDSKGKELVKKKFGTNTLNGQTVNWLDFIGHYSDMAAAKLNSNSKEDIILAPANNYAQRVFVYHYDSDKKIIKNRADIGFSYKTGYTLTAGQVYQEAGESWPREEMIIATKDNKIRILDAGNFDRRLQPDLAAKTPGKDIILWAGHGNTWGWGGVLDAHSRFGFPVNFGGHNPVIMGISCLTGNYQRPKNEHKHIAESLLSEGAGVYIGSTENSWGYTNREAAYWLFKNWKKGESIGDAFTMMERYTWNNDPTGAKNLTESWHIWIWQYNLYGDPKFGAPLSTSALALDGPTLIQDPSDPPTILDVDVPPYEIERDAFGAGLDDVSIPGGSLWLEPGQLRLPYTTAVVELPADSTVEEVSLLQRGGFSEETAVHIPITQADPQPCSCTPLPAPGTGDGFFPETPFEWQIVEGNGARTLVIRLFPLQYNPQTTDLLSWNDYRFEILYGRSSSAIAGITLSEEMPEPGQPLTAEVHLLNEEEGGNLLLEGEILAASDGRRLRGLPLQHIKQLHGPGSLTLPLDLEGLPAGYYTLRTRLLDGSGRWQGTQELAFQLGAADMAITSLSANPRPVAPGQDAHVVAAVRNNGSGDVDGFLVLDVRNKNGDLLATNSHPFNGLAPGATFHAESTVLGEKIGSGEYRLVATALFSSRSVQATLPLSEVGMEHLYLPVVVRKEIN